MDSGRAILAAEEVFQRGEVLLKKGDHAKALEAFAQAMKANPLEPAYKAYWAWTRFDSPNAAEGPPGARHAEGAGGGAARAHQVPGGPLLDRACCTSTSATTANAENAFRNALAQDKALLEAERELRLMEMRRIRASTTHPTADRPRSGTATAARKEPAVCSTSS